jgi:hypothetical protein
MGFEKAVPFYILTLLFIIAAIYIIIEALNKISNEKFFAKLAYSSAGIAIINAGLGYLGTTSMRFKEDSELLKMVSPVPLENLLNMSLGYSIINILLINTIFIFAIGVLLYYIRQKNIIFKILQFIESKKRIIKICYLVLILIVGAIACINLLSSLNHMKDMINVPNMFNVPL